MPTPRTPSSPYAHLGDATLAVLTGDDKRGVAELVTGVGVDAPLEEHLSVGRYTGGTLWTKIQRQRRRKVKTRHFGYRSFDTETLYCFC